MSKRTLFSFTFAAILAVATFAFGQPPERDISRGRHPNLAAAQRLAQQAWEKLGEAQRANEFDMRGHAAKAKELLDQANREMKLAAETANRH